MTDADLVARARRGDTAAFGELVDRHRTAVFRAARAALGSHAEAEDAAQDAFVAAFQRLDSFRGEASFKTWMLAIAWRHAINRRRSLTRWWTRTQPFDANRETDAPPLEVAHPGPSPERLAAGRQVQRAIADGIRALPPKLRDALLLAHTGELSYDEIAAMTKSPVGTVKWRVFEARKRIKTRLEALGFSDVG